MISRRSSFKLLERGYGGVIVLIPGWATDSRIFSDLDLPLDYLIPREFAPFNFEGPLLEAMDAAGRDTFSILGWSMGSFLASELAAKHPQRFKEAILVSARAAYDPRAIEEIKRRIKGNKAGYLYKFYNNFFSDGEKEAAADFKRRLAKSYAKEMDAKSLLEGLDYLMSARLRRDNLEGIDLRFVHGTEDKIAPIEEARTIKGGLPRASFVPIEGAGHAPFLRPDFGKLLYESISE